MSIPSTDAPTAPGQGFLSFFIADADSDQIIRSLGPGDVVEAADFQDRNVTLAAIPSGAGPEIGSVELILGSLSRVENVSPYALFGDSNGDFVGTTGFTSGPQTLEVKVFSGANKSGTQLDSFEVPFTFGETSSGGGDDPPADVLADDFDQIVFHFDGNNNDPDDIAAIPVAALLALAGGVEEKTSFFYGNNLAEANSNGRLEDLDAGADFARGLGVSAYSYQAGIAEATAELVEILNSGQKVLMLEGGPMEAAYRALEQTDPSNLPNITLLSHSSWNENRSVINNPSDPTLTEARTWSDIRSDFPTVTMIDIRDQNDGNNNDSGFNNRNWDWLDSTEVPEFQAARQIMDEAGSTKTNDPSDAGMLFYALTGIENGTPQDAQSFLENSGAFNGDLPDLSIRNRRVEEGEGAVLRFRLDLSEASDEAVTVAYRTQDSTAKAGQDFVAESGVVTFAPGETRAFVEIDVVNDEIEESEERLLLKLSSATGATIIDDVAIGRIENDDQGGAPLPGLSVNNRRVEEGGGVTTRFRIDLSEPSNQEVTVDYFAQASTAKAGSDFIAESGSVTFAAGETRAFVEIDIVNDDLAEEEERFLFKLENAQGAGLLDAVASGWIEDDDLVPAGDEVEATLPHFETIRSGAYQSSPNADFPEVTPTTRLVQENDFGQGGFQGHGWGGVNPQMYRGFDYQGRDREIGEPVGSGPTLTVNAGMTTQQIEAVIDSAPTGATVLFEAGTYWLTQSIDVQRGDLHIKGASEASVILRADAITDGHVFDVSKGINGKLGPEEAILVTGSLAPVAADDRVVALASVAGVKAGDFIEFTYNNSGDLNTRITGNGDSFNKLSSLVEIAAVDSVAKTVTLKEKAGMDYDPDWSGGNAEVRVYDQDDFIHNLVISDMTIRYMEDSDYAQIVDPHDLFNYNSSDYGGAYDNKASAIHLQGVHESDILNLTVENAGSLGIWVSAGYQVGIQNYTFDGSQNLGGGGNGYGLLLDDSFYGDYEGLRIGGENDEGLIAATRHAVVFGYSSSAAYNNIHIEFTNSNIDFHGGADFGNIYYVEIIDMTQMDHYNFGVMDDRFVLDGLYYNKIQNTYIFDQVRAHEEGPIPNYVGSLVPGQEDGQGHWANNGIASPYVDVVYMSAKGGEVRTFGKDDEIHSGVGDDDIWGGNGEDDFLFYNRNGTDRIHDFEGGDRIGVAIGVNGTDSDTAADVAARASQSGDHTVIDLGAGHSVTLMNVQAGSLEESDFFVF
ncbi:MAG: Calx-beta domain-containing protein [Pseudomonadota bacterium]